MLGLKAATKKGGTLLVHGYTPKQINFGTGRPKDVSLMYTKETFTGLFNEMILFPLKSIRQVYQKALGIMDSQQ